MGRAYEVRKASIQKTGAAKAKLYSMYAREIYQAAKNGGISLDANASLKRLVEKSKKDQVPGDIIKRAIDKVSSGADESYEEVNYELFGPAGSTLIASCLTDNINRSVSSIRTVVNKCHVKLGSMGSVSYQYENLCVVGFKGIDEEEILNALIEAGIDADDIEVEDGLTMVYGNPKDLHDIKRAIEVKSPNIEFEIDEITWIPKEKINIENQEDKDLFEKLLTMLEDIEDVQNVYHNVEI